MLEALACLLRKNVDDLHPGADPRNGVQLIPEENALLRPAAVENGQIEVLHAVPDGIGHGQERGDAAAACQSDDMECIPQPLIAQGLGRSRTEPIRQKGENQTSTAVTHQRASRWLRTQV